MPEDRVVIPFPVRAEAEEPESTPLLREVLGDVLREERVDQGRTLREVAEEAHVSIAHLSELERGLKEGSSEVFESITRSLDVDVADLLERAAERLRGPVCRGMGGSGPVLSLAA